jgi:hypothetical protein
MAQKIYVKNAPDTFRVYLPWEKDEADTDKTWFEHRKMDEADYQKFVDLTSTVKLGGKKKDGGDTDKAEVDMKLGATRAFLIETLIVDWNVIGEDGKVLGRTPNNVKRLPPEIVKVWVEDIYEQNPILKAEEEDAGDKEIKTVKGKTPLAE